MKWNQSEEGLLQFTADGIRNIYNVKQYFFHSIKWVIKIINDDNEIIKIPAMFSKSAKAKKVCELLEKG